MSDLTQIAILREEARNILSRAEEIVRNLGSGGACEGRNLMAAQNIAALRRLNLILERHHSRLACEATPDAVDRPLPIRRHWWSALRWGMRGQGHAFEART